MDIKSCDKCGVHYREEDGITLHRNIYKYGLRISITINICYKCNSFSGASASKLLDNIKEYVEKEIQ